jgi:hypothetical protein
VSPVPRGLAVTVCRRGRFGVVVFWSVNLSAFQKASPLMMGASAGPGLDAGGATSLKTADRAVTATYGASRGPAALTHLQHRGVLLTEARTRVRRRARRRTRAEGAPRLVVSDVRPSLCRGVPDHPVPFFLLVIFIDSSNTGHDRSSRCQRFASSLSPLRLCVPGPSTTTSAAFSAR